MRNNRKRGFSLIELLIVVAVILIVAAIASLNLMRARIAANESSAVSSMRSITNAEIAYAITYGEGYASDLSTFGPTDKPDKTKTDTLDQNLANGKKQGYLFKVVSATQDDFRIDANPEAPGRTGIRNFCSDQSSVIHSGVDDGACDLTSASLQ